MAKVITTIAAEDGMDFNDIVAFKTDTHVGIWDCGRDEWLVFLQFGGWFDPMHFEQEYTSLLELDKAIYDCIEEHITDVFNKGGYSFYLDQEGGVVLG